MSGISLNLTKGMTLDLTKKNQGLDKIEIGLGWDMLDGHKGIDLDSLAVLSGSGSIQNSVNYMRLKTKGIFLNGDNRTGAGDGDDEIITATLSEIPKSVDRISILVNIFNPKQITVKKSFFKSETISENFGLIKNAYIRIVDCRTGNEVCRYNLTEDGNGYNAFHMADIVREGSEWVIKAVGEPTNGSISTLEKYIQSKL